MQLIICLWFQPKAAITTLSNVATASMENALPTTQSTSTMLAPEELFAPASKSDLVARSELDPLAKKRMRQKDRKTRMRQRQALDSAVDKYAGKAGGGGKARGGVKSQKDRALKELVKTGKGVSVSKRNSHGNIMLISCHVRSLSLGKNQSRSLEARENQEKVSVRALPSSYKSTRLDRRLLSSCITGVYLSYMYQSRHTIAQLLYIYPRPENIVIITRDLRPTHQSSLPTSPLQPLSVLENSQIESPGLIVDPNQPLVVSIDFLPGSHSQPLERPRYFQSLVQILINLIFELIIALCRFELITRSSLLTSLDSSWFRTRVLTFPEGSTVETSMSVLNIRSGLFTILSFFKMTIKDPFFLSLSFPFLNDHRIGRPLAML
jgi:hypothetical protein